MQHILDNPIWNALISGNNGLALGNEQARYFPQDVSPFVGLRDFTEANFNILHETVPYKSMLAVFSANKIEQFGKWNMLRYIQVYQMIYSRTSPPPVPQQDLISLNDKDVPAMQALTKLTNPGPFFQNTIQFGNYRGFFDDDKLIAMAGQRLHPYQYVEISAVCTHPDYQGKGYASQLISDQINLIMAESCVPFLHVINTNPTAIKVYERLGFVKRREMFIYTIQK